jgi:hypothetical protein
MVEVSVRARRRPRSFIKADIKRRVRALFRILDVLADEGLLGVDLSQIRVTSITLQASGYAIATLHSEQPGNAQTLEPLFQKITQVGPIVDLSGEVSPSAKKLILHHQEWVQRE